MADAYGHLLSFVFAKYAGAENQKANSLLGKSEVFWKVRSLKIVGLCLGL